MKIRFTEAPKGREYKVGEVVEFTGPIPEGYARKYINRGWAVEVTAEKPSKKSEDAPQAQPASATRAAQASSVGKPSTDRQ